MKKLVPAAVGALIGSLVTLALLKGIRWPSLEIGGLGFLGVVTVLPIVFVVLVAIHEGGHLVAGSLMRFRACLFIVGPIKLERTTRGWRMGMNRVFPWSGGMVAATPDGVDRLRQRMIALIAGGPSASLLFGTAVLAGLASIESMGHRRLSGLDAVVFLTTAVAGAGSLALGLIALVPGQGHGFSSDGARIVRFLRAGAGTDAEVALLSIVSASMAGQRPRNWSGQLVERALQLAPGVPMGAAARMLAHVHALDRDDIDQAREYLRSALANVAALPAMSRPALFLLAAYFEAIHDGNPDSARRRLAHSGGGVLLSPHSRAMAEGAVLLAEGDPRAAEMLALASREIPRALDRGSAELAADLIGRMQRRLHEPPSSSP